MTAAPSQPTPSPAGDVPPSRIASDGRARHAAEPTIGHLVTDVQKHISELVHDEIELAKAELKPSLRYGLVGTGMFVAAVVVLFFSLTFGFIALAEGLARAGLPRWLAFLAVFVFLLLIVALLVLLGIRSVKRVRGPQRTVESTKETVDYLKRSRRP